jgi:hypothetical protein
MAKTLTITASDEEFQATVDALCQRGGYNPAKDGDAVAFAKGVLFDFLGRVRKQAAMAPLRSKHAGEIDEAVKKVDAAGEAARASVKVSVT